MRIEELEYDCIYRFHHYGSCDNCGAIHDVDLFGIYKGEIGGAHMFEIAPFSCLGCSKVVLTVKHVYPIDVTKELESLKK